MKTKLSTGILLMNTVTGLALALNGNSATAFIHVKFNGVQNFVCLDSKYKCSDSGTIPCTVYITDLGRSTPTYRAGCVTQLFDFIGEVGQYDNPNAEIVGAD